MFKAIRRWRRGGKMQTAVHKYQTWEAEADLDAYARSHRMREIMALEVTA